MKCRLKQLLDERGISQTQFSIDTGLSNATVSKLCRNVFEAVSRPTIETVAEHLGLSEIGELFELETPPSSKGKREK